MFKRNKLSSAIQIALAATLTVTLSGCLEGDSTVSYTSAEVGDSNNFERVANPVGTIVGLVTDIQGNPLAGATVSIGGRSVRTGTGGTYQFTDIPVTDVVVNTTDSLTGTSTQAILGTVAQGLMISIVPPSGYLGATVTVTAPAAVIDYGGDGECSDSGVTANTTTTCAVNADTSSFIDGFIAQAGTAVLPALNATVTGILRNATTGVALPNTAVSFRMTRTYDGTEPGPTADNPVLANTPHNDVGVKVAYGVRNLTTTTDANGNFTISNVPSKSELLPMVAGYTTGAIDFNNGIAASSISTNNWTSDIEVGAVMLTPLVATLDTIAPFVTRVTSVTNGAPGLFNDDVDLTTAGTGIVVGFNEPLADSVDATVLDNSVEILVWNDTGASAGDAVYDMDESSSGSYVTPTSIVLSSDRTSMTVFLPANITEGQSIHVNLLAVDFTDEAGNQLVVNPAGSMTYDSSIGGASTGNGTFIRLGMSTFVEINKLAPAVTVSQLASDASGVDIDPYPLSQNAVFADVQDGDAATLIQQLNATDDDGVGVNDASTRLAALHSAIGGTAAGVDGDQALISFDPTTASGYIITVVNELGVNQGAPVTVTDIAGNVTPVLGNVFTAVNANTINLVLNNVEAGWSVTITPTDDLGYYGTPTTITLIDNVPPTTVLQTSYGVTSTSSYLVTGDTFGDGGELVNDGSPTGGTPYLNVTAQMLDNLAADGTASLLTADDDDTLDEELTAFNFHNATTNTPYITTGYDSTAYTAMAAAASRAIGVAFSEDVTYVSDPAYSGTAALSAWSALNDVMQQDDGVGINADLMTATVDSVFTLAADNNAVLDFTDDVTDSAATPLASIAAVNPKVVVRDALPPFITEGTYNGDDIILTFNEVVVPANGDQFVFDDGTSATLSVFPANGDESAENYAWNATTNTLTINATAWGGDLTLLGGAGAFPLSAYSSPTTGEHGLLTFMDIRDANENNWDANGGYGIPAIPFALETTVSPTMSVTETSSSATAASTSFTVVYTSSHRIDMTIFGAAADATSLTTAQVAANFTLAGTGVIDTVNTTSGSLSSNGRVLTLTIALTTGLAAADSFDFTGNGGNIDSDWDGAQSDNPGAIVVP